MYEFHGWFGLSESTEETDVGGFHPALNELKVLLDSFTSPSTVRAALFPLNGEYFLTITAFVNRRRSEAEHIEQILQFVAERLPGSWGLTHERDDEIIDWPGPNAYRVRYLTRGHLEVRGDPFLSPCRPTIED